MIIDYVGVKEINGSLIVIDGVKGASLKKSSISAWTTARRAREESSRWKEKGSSSRYLKGRGPSPGKHKDTAHRPPDGNAAFA